jgi:hypothetical protein
MQFWQLKAPEYDSDYQEKYINGNLEHLFTVPPVKCSVCGESWGTSRFLPQRCPPSAEKLLLQFRGHTVSLDEFREIKSKLLGEFKIHGIAVPELYPGDVLQPCHLDVPSRPSVDFLWASLGSLVVSQKIKNLFETYCASDITCCHVTLRKIGKGKYNERIPIPDSGEPEDMIKGIEIAHNREISPYFEVCLSRESKLPVGVVLKSTCSACGRREYEQTNRQISMTDDMWNGAKIFHMATTLRVVVKDEIKICIERLVPTNVCFSKI